MVRVNFKVKAMLFPNGDHKLEPMIFPRGFIGDIDEAYMKDKLFGALLKEKNVAILVTNPERILAENEGDKTVRTKSPAEKAAGKKSARKKAKQESVIQADENDAVDAEADKPESPESSAEEKDGEQ